MVLTSGPARNLATTTKTIPMWDGITPRWPLRLLPWVDVKAGTYRINAVETPPVVIAEHDEGKDLPVGGSQYVAKPKEIDLSVVQTVLKMHTRILDLHSYPHDQLREQLRLSVEALQEEKERRVINSAAFGLLSSAAKSMRIPTQSGPPTPDDMDTLLSMVWKDPAFFLAHPRAIAAFGKQCSQRGLRLETIEMHGVPFSAWRGVPLVPCDKIPLDKDSSSILLMRVGEERRGVVGLHQDGIGDANLPSLSVRHMGIDDEGMTSYLVTSYFSIAVLVDDALAVLDGVQV